MGQCAELRVMTEQDKENYAAWVKHMNTCLHAVLIPIGRKDAEVTIIVRVPEATPSEAMVSSNDSRGLAAARDAIAYVCDMQKGEFRGKH